MLLHVLTPSDRLFTEVSVYVIILEEVRTYLMKGSHELTTALWGQLYVVADDTHVLVNLVNICVLMQV